MLPTFVIGLREGLEAALIVGIIAAFLRKQNRGDLVRAVLGGVLIAVLLCVGAGVALQAYSRDLPQKQQEGLETIIGALAVAMVTYMVIWMRRNSRGLKGQLEGMAADAIGGRSGAGRAMVLMAFLAVIREGLETVVFVLAAFNEAANGTTAGVGLLLGLGVAVVLGYGIYRGGVHLNLSKFFRGTGIVLVLVAAGLVVNALHTAHEAGWIQVGQNRTLDLSWLVDPGSVQSSLLTGMLGLQPFPVTIEVLGWLLYLVPVGLYIAWPPGRAVPHRKVALGAGSVAAVALVAAVLLSIVAPSAPSAPSGRPTTSGGGISATVLQRSGQDATVRITAQNPVDGTTGPLTTYRLTSQGDVTHDGSAAERFRATVAGSGTAGRPTTLDAAAAAALNGNRLPIGIRSTDGSIGVTYRDPTTLTIWLDRRTDRVLDATWREVLSAQLTAGSRVAALDAPLRTAGAALPASARAAASIAAAHDADTLNSRRHLQSSARWLFGLAVVAALAALGFFFAGRRREAVSDDTAVPVPVLVTS